MIPARAPLNGFSPGRPGLSPSSAPAPASHAPPASPRTKIHPGAAFSVVFAENAARTRECPGSARRSRSAPHPSRLTCRWVTRSLGAKASGGGTSGSGMGRPGSPLTVVPPQAEQTAHAGSSAKPVRLTRRVRPAGSAGGTTVRGWGQAGEPLCAPRWAKPRVGSHPSRESQLRPLVPQLLRRLKPTHPRAPGLRKSIHPSSPGIPVPTHLRSPIHPRNSRNPEAHAPPQPSQPRQPQAPSPQQPHQTQSPQPPRSRASVKHFQR